MRGTKNLRESQPLMPVGKVGFGANRSSFGRQTMSMNMSSACASLITHTPISLLSMIAFAP